jgi:hypothetical protein
MTPDWPSCYEFRIRGYLSTRRFPWLAQMNITALPNGETRLVSLFEDQAALYGFLSRIRDMGVLLLSVNRLQEAGRE